MEINLSIVAAGVAQTGLQAQQLGRRRAARAQQSYRQTREIQEVAAAHLRAVDENDEGSNAGVHVAITADLPEHHTPQTDQPAHHRKANAAGDEAILAIEAINQNTPSPDQVTQANASAPSDDAKQAKSQSKPKPPMLHVDVQA